MTFGRSYLKKAKIGLQTPYESVVLILDARTRADYLHPQYSKEVTEFMNSIFGPTVCNELKLLQELTDCIGKAGFLVSEHSDGPSQISGARDRYESIGYSTEEGIQTIHMLVSSLRVMGTHLGLL